MRRLGVFIATCGYIGFAPIAPGTFGSAAGLVSYCSDPATRGVQVNDVWDSGVCNGAAFHDSEGNGLLLHRRYAAYPDGSLP